MKRALVVVDVQNEHVEGVLGVTHPSLHVSMQNIALAMDTSAELAIPTVVVSHVEAAGSPHFAAGSADAGTEALIADNPRDTDLSTSGSGDPAERRLSTWLHDHEVTVATMVGFTAEGTLGRLARLIADAGIDVEVLADATGSHEPDDHTLDARAVYERAMDDLEHRRGIRISTASRWDDAAHRGVPAERAGVRLSHEQEAPDPRRDRFEQLVARVRDGIDALVADGDAYQILHTFSTSTEY